MARSSKWFPTPCLQPNGVVQVTTKKDPRIRLPRIPETILPSEKRAATALDTIRVQRIVVEQGEEISMDKSTDQDRGKGATEQNPQSEDEGGNTSMQSQFGAPG
jgi:hypothetical protein